MTAQFHYHVTNDAEKNARPIIESDDGTRMFAPLNEIHVKGLTLKKLGASVLHIRADALFAIYGYLENSKGQSNAQKIFSAMLPKEFFDMGARQAAPKFYEIDPKTFQEFGDQLEKDSTDHPKNRYLKLAIEATNEIASKRGRI